MRDMETKTHARTAPSRRALLGVMAGLPAAAAIPSMAQAQSHHLSAAHDPVVWAHLVAIHADLRHKELRACCAYEKAEADAWDAEGLPLPPPPAGATIEEPPMVVILGDKRLEGSPTTRTFSERHELEEWCAKHPDKAAGRLEAWDAWKRECEAVQAAARVPQIMRRERVVKARWMRTFDRLQVARERVLSYPTLNPAAIKTKLEIASDNQYVGIKLQIANSLFRALGFNEEMAFEITDT